jgi:hypothetical protein
MYPIGAKIVVPNANIYKSSEDFFKTGTIDTYGQIENVIIVAMYLFRCVRHAALFVKLWRTASELQFLTAPHPI